jgi:LysM repeat protein
MSDETLEDIASRYCLNCDELCRLNGMKTDEFTPGSFIVLPKNESPYDSFLVSSGDNLYDISKKTGIDVDLLSFINGIDNDDYIYPGNRILIPKKDYSFYMITDGDTVSDLYDSFGIDDSKFIDGISNLMLLPDQIVFYKRD